MLAARRRNSDGLRVLAVGDAYVHALSADLLYACDPKWWKAAKGAPEFEGERWTQDKGWGARNAPTLADAGRWRLNVVQSAPLSLPSFDPDKIAQGDNSGFQALNLVALMGANPIILVGFDMQAAPDGTRHCEGAKVSPTLAVNSPYSLFRAAFDRAAPVYAANGVTVFNASRRSALKCFRQVNLEQVLA